MCPRNERGLKQLPDGRWQFSWKFEGRYHRRIARTKTEARACLEKIRTQIREGRYMDRRKEVKVPFKEALDRFKEWSEVNVRPSTAYSDRGIVKRLLKSPAFAGKTLDKITPADIERYKVERLSDPVRKPAKKKKGAEKENKAAAGDETKTVCKRTVDMDLGRLKRAFNLFVEWGLCEKNPVAKVKFFREDVRRVRYLTTEEEGKLKKAAPTYLWRVVRFALNTGMRRGEILGLRWEDIDLRNAVAVIPASRAKGKRDRFIPLNTLALAALDELPRPIDSSMLVFGNPQGKAEMNLERMWRKAVTTAGIEDFRFHDLRHTFASRLVTAGEDLAVLRELLGHSTFQMTLRYAHLAPSRLKEAVSRPAKLQLSCDPAEGASAAAEPAQE